ncbi:hypothetical protein ABT381_05620 [Streptomyces sp. NPDC000151]|uniref:hypothetical protein n=1 Tax=Streptomyces sp. NPDC000151 TaxID=3154244 RepID=UPI00331C7F9B
MRTKKFLLLLGATSAGLAAIVGGTTAADADDAPKVHAPYAQAGAVVNADGTVRRSKGVVSVEKVNPGRYCLKVAPDVDFAKSIPVATTGPGAKWNADIRVASGPSGVCGKDPQKLGVYTGVKGAYADQPFNVIVP